MGPYFNSRDKHYKDPFGAVPCGAEVRFALADDTYYGCELLVLREFAGTEDTCALPPAEGGFAGTYTVPPGGQVESAACKKAVLSVTPSFTRP